MRKQMKTIACHPERSEGSAVELSFVRIERRSIPDRSCFLGAGNEFSATGH
jgi:hypothetical protein